MVGKKSFNHPNASSPYDAGSDDEGADELADDEVIIEEAGRNKPFAKRVAGWSTEAIERVGSTAPLVGQMAQQGVCKGIGVAEGVGTAAAGKIEMLIGSLPAGRKPRHADTDADDQAEQEQADEFDDCGQPLPKDPELCGPPGAKCKNLEALVGSRMDTILDGVDAGVHCAEAPMRRVQETVERMDALADALRGFYRPVGRAVSGIERAVVGFVDSKVSPKLGSVNSGVFAGSPNPRGVAVRHAHSHEH